MCQKLDVKNIRCSHDIPIGRNHHLWCFETPLFISDDISFPIFNAHLKHQVKLISITFWFPNNSGDHKTIRNQFDLFDVFVFVLFLFESLISLLICLVAGCAARDASSDGAHGGANGQTWFLEALLYVFFN